MQSFSSLMGNQTLLPIITAQTPEQGVSIARAMSQAGIKLVEVVLRTPASLEALQAIKAELPELIVGAGTVLDAARLQQTIDAGSDFIVTPAISDKLLSALAESQIAALPGVSNTADILLASEHGFNELKLFPASLCGGAAFLKAVSSVFQGINFCPTGGVSADNKQDYLSLNNVFAVGGTWVSKAEWVEAQNWQAITDACVKANS
ncbi:bifunctional 4-hydroxy-2-oxoglutarate aldolase/2-dehydro-3-deoxy-phosphogluconate aldolase [Neptunicella marina]|uniref:Bifunctional 4-hydroxy-2-oxoglutarate aldolase/2-dehydro-3-deoxy-phosphogluconate aldolase n=1 Tax=Neptunicella marina TaxID=2125989 RepID=A0A8J6IUG4_9ALTE|nr:bifunctional 4-hydroxy-2-oxoglutarate aldolase/2-dehydro-3-deoxy-phosphogluconate aldolase [Neptunicella marina]MBC3765673.1 bifunctional 4-hydroxy-2-oxoglutarate aldolase/2-dehydro-3-deoxy-phosphogluconate aldolase [Neptunicella marina]